MMLRYHQNVSTKVLLHYSMTGTFDILTNTANIYQPNLTWIFHALLSRDHGYVRGKRFMIDPGSPEGGGKGVFLGKYAGIDFR